MKKKILTIIGIIVTVTIIVVLAILAFKPRNEIPNGSVKLTAGEENANEDNPLKDLYIHFSGIPDSTINDKSVVELTNLETNGDIVMAFKVYEGDTMLYETDYIESGTHLNWEAGKMLSPGEHNITVVEIPKIEIDGEYIDLTSASNTVKFTVIE